MLHTEDVEMFNIQNDGTKRQRYYKDMIIVDGIGYAR